MAAWVEVAPKLGAEETILSLAVFNSKLYGGTYPNGKLYEWNGTNAWVEVAPKLGAETDIPPHALAVFNNKLYGGTSPNGKLYEWNGTNAWVEVAPKLGAETYIASLAVFNSKLYGGTHPNGKLYEWNGTNAWVEVAPKLGAEEGILSLAVFNNKLYGGTLPNGKLYEWNGTNAWVEVAPKLGEATYIWPLAVFNNKLYGGASPNGKLYEWNGTNAWVEVAPTLGAEIYIASLAVFNSKLYGGTDPNGKLYEWNGYGPTITSFTPLSGPVGTTVTITGTGFSTTPSENIVKFNGTAAVVDSSSATEIVTTVPVGATTGTITVETSGGIATSTDIFTVVICSDVDRGLLKILPVTLGRVPINGTAPQYWFQWGQYIVIEPVPDNVYLLTLFVSDYPETELTLTTDYPDGLPDEFHSCVVDYACFVLSLRMKKWKKAAKYYNLYIKNLKQRKKDFMDRQADRQRLHSMPDRVIYPSRRVDRQENQSLLE